MKRSQCSVAGVVLMGLICLLSLLPPSAKFALHMQGALHPWLHLMAFLAAGFLLTVATSSARQRIAILIAIIVLGFGTEIVEQWINATPLETSDIFADTVGAVLGLLAAILIAEQ